MQVVEVIDEPLAIADFKQCTTIFAPGAIWPFKVTAQPCSHLCWKMRKEDVLFLSLALVPVPKTFWAKKYLWRGNILFVASRGIFSEQMFSLNLVVETSGKFV